MKKFSLYFLWSLGSTHKKNIPFAKFLTNLVPKDYNARTGIEDIVVEKYFQISTLWD